VTRTVAYKQLITYTVTRDEALEAIVRECKTNDGVPLLPDPARIEGLADEIVLVYEYDYEPRPPAPPLQEPRPPADEKPEDES
jgi:hypothetical protein